MRRTIILILLGFLLTSCGSGMYYFSTINHEPEYIGDVRVDKIENRMDLNWKLRTDNQFRWDFAQYAQNQPLSWYYDNSWELGLYTNPYFTTWDFYFNRTQLWWDWSFNHPYNWGWNRWYPFGYNRWGWNYGFRNNWAWGYNPYRWNSGFVYNPQPIRNRNVVVVNGRRGSNNTNITINRGRSNNSTSNNSNVRVRKYDNKDRIVPRRDYNDIKSRVRTPINNNSRPTRNYNVPRPNNNNNVRRTPPPPPTRPVVRPNVSRSSNVGRSSSQVIKRNND
jgi:hypothetical protein